MELLCPTLKKTESVLCVIREVYPLIQRSSAMLKAVILLGTPQCSELLFYKLTLVYTTLGSKEGWIHGRNFPVYKLQPVPSLHPG